MIVRCLLAALLLLTPAAPAAAQSWARKMFKTTHHDFGVVARGAKAEFAFQLTNLYKEDVHIAAVRSSCGCTTPIITKRTLKTWEQGAIVAHYNTSSFLGYKGATITVTFDRPFYAEVQLTVTGYIRSDVVFSPGEVNFGEVQLGEGAEQAVTVSYAGRSDWKIIDVRSANPHLEVELNEPSRAYGRVTYQMVVRLKPDAPPGYINDQLTVVTDEQRMQTIPLAVSGRVLSPVTVSPATLFLGVLRPGQSAVKNLVLRAAKPFRVLGVHCDNPAFQFRVSDEAKTLHIIPVTFQAGAGPAKVAETLRIQTDLVDRIECVATATVTAPEGEANP